MSIILDALKKMRGHRNGQPMWIFSAKGNSTTKANKTNPSPELPRMEKSIFKDQRTRQRRVWILAALNILLIGILAMTLSTFFRQKEEQLQAVFITPEIDRSSSASPLNERPWTTTVVWPQAYPLESAQVIQEQVADLFSLAAPSESTHGKFRLSGTYGDTHGEKIAIVNDRFLHIGDRIRDARVVKIDNGSVDLDVDGKLLHLKT